MCSQQLFKPSWGFNELPDDDVVQTNVQNGVQLKSLGSVLSNFEQRILSMNPEQKQVRSNYHRKNVPHNQESFMD